MIKNLNILICPLEWGLGHATRMIPLARRLIEMKGNILIGCGKEHQALFSKELPGLAFIDFPGFRPSYSGYFPQYLILLIKTPVLVYHTIVEHIRLKKIIRKYSINIVISDNRFGLWNRDVVTVYVTHMPRIPFPKHFTFLEFIGILMHRAIIRKYDYCYIPDLPGSLNVSGRLSHGIRLPDNVRYIGLLSRFSSVSQDKGPNPFAFRHNTVILSGPEPQREILKQKLAEILKDREPITVFLEGRPGIGNEMRRSGNIVFYNHLDSPGMMDAVSSGETIITRAGYTTIMELISMKCSAILIPTPGQTEQEYLGRYLAGKGWFRSVLQKEIAGELLSNQLNDCPAEEMISQSRILLDNAMNELSGNYQH